MHFNNNITELLSRVHRTPLKPKQEQIQGTLSRQDLQRIVASMVG